MALDATKLVLRVPNTCKVRLIEISLRASLDIIISNKRITKTLIRLYRCLGWSVPLLFTNPGRLFSCLEVPFVESISQC